MKELRPSKKLLVESMEFVELVVSSSSQCSVKFVDFVESSRCFAGRLSLSSWFALWDSYCLIVYKDMLIDLLGLVVFVKLCRGVGILSASECGLLTMSCWCFLLS